MLTLSVRDVPAAARSDRCAHVLLTRMILVYLSLTDYVWRFA